MKNQQITPELITIENGQPVTTSLKIAELFRKQHKNVIQRIETLQCSSDFNRLNFKPIFYNDSYNRKQKGYEITKDGFAILVMGYNGKKAMEFKEKYINAFNQMATNMKNVLEHNQQPKKTKVIDAPAPVCYTVTAWERVTKTMLTSRMRKVLGKEASKICREQGYPIEKIPHQRWGVINAYPVYVLEQLFNKPHQFSH